MFQRILQGQTELRNRFGGNDDGTGGDGGSGPNAESLDPKRMYGETQKLSRLLRVKDEKLSELQQQVDALTKNQQKFNQLFREDPPADSEIRQSLGERARAGHDRMRQLDPESSGMPLTVDVATSLDEAREIIKKQQERLDQLERGSSPQGITERQMFVSIESFIEQELFDLYGSEQGMLENYPDFERSAIEKIKVMRNADPRKYKHFLINPTAQRDFVKGLVQAKIPRGYEPKGAQKIDAYGQAEAAADRKLAETSKNPLEREAAARRSRQWWLAESAILDR